MFRYTELKLDNQDVFTSDKSSKSRNEIDNRFKWNISAMYSDEVIWEKDLNKALTLADEFKKYKGVFSQSSRSLLNAFKHRDEIYQIIEKVYVYSRMKRDEDNSNEKYQALCDKSQVALSKISEATAFFVPELLSNDESHILSLLSEEDELSVYEFAIKDMFKQKAHTLSTEEESLMAQMSQLNSATNNIFTMLNNADIKFGYVTMADGEKIELTHGNYISFLENSDKSIRKQAYELMYGAYENLINTLATAYSFNTKTDAVISKIRKYNSSIEAALSGDNVKLEVYDNLISVINKRLPALHKYMNLRKKALKVKTLNMCDVYAPLFEIPSDSSTVSSAKIEFDQAVEIMKSALAPLGKSYINTLQSGIDKGWIDIYENRGKTSGAYSFGSYDSMPYVLLNYTNTLKDVFTLVHEMGHSMHSFYTRKTQPYIYGDHSIFTAEVASTVNENLLVKHLISNETSLEMKKYLLTYHIEEFRTTVFRQTMFAEFEKWTHSQIESGQSLTAQSMSEYYLALNKKYFGDAVEMDDFIQYEWARIPHFYNAFYVYKYATGYCAAAAISDIILEKGPDDYLKFLTTGTSNYPIPLLQIAGVDMSSPDAINRGMDVFEGLVDELEKLI